MLKNFLVVLLMIGSGSAWAQSGTVSSERALLDSVVENVYELCEQFQINVQDAEVQNRIHQMFGHLDLNTKASDCKSLAAVVAFSFEREDLKAWAGMGSEMEEKIMGEYSLLIGQLARRQLADGSKFQPPTDLELFEIVILKGFYDGMKSHLRTGN